MPLLFQKIRGTSMLPTIRPNDICVLQRKKMTKGDIISFYSGSRILTHRVVKFKGNQIFAKGDNNKYLDPIINNEDVIGTVVSIIKFEGFQDGIKGNFSPDVRTIRNCYFTTKVNSIFIKLKSVTIFSLFLRMLSEK